MSFGLQLFNADSSLNIDTSNRLARLIASYTLYFPSPGMQTIYYSGLANDNTWFVITDAFTLYKVYEGYVNIFGGAYEAPLYSYVVIGRI